MTIEPASDELIAEIERVLKATSNIERHEIWDDAAALISRIRKEQEDKAVMARALEPFSVMAGILFSRNFNAPDVVMGMTADDGGDMVLNAGDFFAVRKALTGSSTIISDMEAEIAVLRARLKGTEEALLEASEEIDAFKAEAGR